MEYVFTLVNEKKDKLKFFNRTYISGVILIYTIVITMIIVIFNNYLADFTFYLFIIPNLILFFFLFLSFFKYEIIRNFDIVGELIIKDDFVIIKKDNKENTIDLYGKKIKFEYNHIRGKRSSQMGNVHSGINELIINKTHYTFLIENDEHLLFIKEILSQWYKSGFCLIEFSRDIYHHRLLELNDRFDWKRLNEVKKNCN